MQTPGKLLVQKAKGRGSSKNFKKRAKAGIRSTASLNSEGVGGFPLSLSLHCRSTFLTESRHLSIRNFAGVSRGKQVKAAAICPLSLIARLKVVLDEMLFSVRVHPAPFSPTPKRHAGIKLKMKGGGLGASRLGRTMTFVLVHQPTFGQQAQTKLLGLREISC